MIRRTLPVLLLAIVAVLGAIALPAADVAAVDPAPSAPESFEIDLAHSTVLYRIRHLDICNFYGRVNMPTGSFAIGASGGHLNVKLELKNMDAGNKSRDRFLLSPDFFNVREYPEAEFRSKSMRKTGDGTYEVVGDFTMRGVTRAITVGLEGYQTVDTEKFGRRAGFECRFDINREDFGMDLHRDSLGDAVHIIASLEGVQR